VRDSLHRTGDARDSAYSAPFQDARYARAAPRRASPVLDRAYVRRPWPGAGSPQATRSSSRIEISPTISPDGLGLVHFSRADLGRFSRALKSARAFGRSERGVRRYQRRFEGGELVALGRPGGYPAGRPRLERSRDRRVHTLRVQGKSQRQIAAAVGVSERAVRKQLCRLG
jgi:hypothetical protein